MTCLTEGYNTNDKYSVVYMHDGQMLFDSTQTWNKKEWLADEIFSENNYKSMVFEKAVHDEIAWSRRLDIPLVFLLGR